MNSPSLSDAFFTYEDDLDIPVLSEDETITADVWPLLYLYRGPAYQAVLYLHVAPDISSAIVHTLHQKCLVVATDRCNEWLFIQSGCNSGWAMSSIKEKIILKRVRHNRCRKYVEWPGQNTFICNGRVMLGSGIPSLISTNVILLSVYVVFLGAVFSDPRMEGGQWGVAALVGLIFIVIFVFLWITALMDPGIIPRASEDEEKPAGGVLAPDVCTICCIERRERSKHCRSCDNCVKDFDHHCSWIGNCIGKRNYRYFVGFLASCTIGTAVILCIAIFQVASQVDMQMTWSYFLLFFAGLGAITLPFLSGYHCYLISTAQTTEEHFCQTFRLSTGRRSVRDKGFVRNWTEALTSPIPPSKLQSMHELVAIDDVMAKFSADRVSSSSSDKIPFI